MFYIGLVGFAIVEITMIIVAFLYTLPIMLTLWLPLLLLYVGLPALAYLICFPIITKGGQEDKKIAYFDNITFVMPQFLVLVLCLAAVHLSRVYYVDYISPKVPTNSSARTYK